MQQLEKKGRPASEVKGLAQGRYRYADHGIWNGNLQIAGKPTKPHPQSHAKR